MLESINFPAPVIALAVEPKTKADQEKLGQGLGKLMQEDPTFKVETDKDTGQTKISGMGELHLEIIVDRLKREFGVEANVGKPQVAYKETIRQPAKGEGRYIKQTGGRGQYGHAKIELEPAPGRRLRLRERHQRAAASPRSSSSRSTRASRKPCCAGSSPATRWWTCA